MDILNQAGALITMALGTMGLVMPNVAARVVSVEPVGLLGRSELRATYGGFFFALGLGCMVIESSQAYLVAGLAWLGAAGGRIVSVIVDRSADVKNIVAVIFEAAIGGMLVT